MYWQRACYLALSCFLWATVARADLLPRDGTPIYRGEVEMSIERLPAGVVLVYLADYSATTSKVAVKQTLTISEPGTLYAVNETLVVRGIVLKTNRGVMHRLKDFGKDDFPVSRSKPDPVQQLSCAVTGDEPSGYALSCRTVETR